MCVIDTNTYAGTIPSLQAAFSLRASLLHGSLDIIMPIGMFVWY